MEDTKEYEECYIAFLDMLGFKKLIEEKSCAFIENVISKINHDIPILMANSKTKRKKADIRVKVISDSICLYISSQMEENLQLLIFSCLCIQHNLLENNPPIFIRGGIVKGNIYSKGDVFFGPGLTKAFLMEENNAKYPRIIITNDLLIPFKNPDSKFFISNLKDLVFRDFDNFYTVNYFDSLESFSPNGGLKDKITDYINKVLDTTIDSSLRDKYNYVLDNILRAEHDS